MWKIESAILNQWSQDMLVANNWNVCQYTAHIHMFEQVSSLNAGELIHVIADAHIYDRHIDLVEQLIGNPPYHAPAFAMNQEIKDFYQFSVDDFTLIDYNAYKFGKQISVAL
jgi:thymidylate synthase